MTLLTAFALVGLIVSAGIFAALWLLVSINRINGGKDE